MKFQSFLSFSATVGLATTVATNPAFAQSNPCPFQPVTPPAQETRTYQNDDYGFSFQLPENYRAVRYRNFSLVDVIDPAGHEVNECLRRAVSRNPGLASDNIPFPVSVSAQAADGRSLREVAMDSPFRPRITRETTIGGQPAVFVVLDDPPIVSGSLTDVLILTPDQRYIIRISESPLLDEVFVTIASSFSFGENSTNTSSQREILLQTQGTLDPSDSRLNDGSLYDVYSLSGQAGKMVSIQLTSNAFDTYLIVVDSNNQTIGENDDYRTGTDSLVTIKVPVDGSYKIITNSYDTDAVGSYSLTVTQNSD